MCISSHASNIKRKVTVNSTEHSRIMDPQFGTLSFNVSSFCDFWQNLCIPSINKPMQKYLETSLEKQCMSDLTQTFDAANKTYHCDC
jgi:hypothetical protein